MNLRTIGILLLVAALIGISTGVVVAEEEQNGHCDEWDSGRDWDNNDDPDGPSDGLPGRDHDGDGKES